MGPPWTLDSEKWKYYVGISVLVLGASGFLALVLLWRPPALSIKTSGIKIMGSSTKGMAAPAGKEEQAFTQSLWRLSDNINRLQPEAPQEVLRQAAAKDPACFFEWNNGQPALLYKRGTTLVGTLSRCADVVDKLTPLYKRQRGK